MSLSEVSKSPEMVQRLNSMPQEPTSTALGYKGNIGGRYKLKGNPKATLREAKREAKAADWWSSRTKNVDRVRQRKRPLLVNRRKYDTMTRLVDSASPASQRLYRGMRVDEVDFKRGQRRSMPESSWTSDRKQADVYTARGDKAKPVVMHLKGQHRSTHIAPLTRYRNAEWVTPKADYDVTSTRTREGAKHVYLRQVEKALGVAPGMGVAKSIPAEEVLPATEEEVKQEVVHRKKKQKTLSQVSAALGLASLGAQVPKAARVAVRNKRLGRSAALRRVARAAPKAKQATDAIVPASLGVGALGSLNFARLAGKEVKAQEQELNKALGQLAWRNRGYFRSLTPAEMERARQVGNKLPDEEDQQQPRRRRRPVNVYKADNDRRKNDRRKNAAAVGAGLSGAGGTLASARPLGEAYKQRKLARFNRRMSSAYADIDRRMSDQSTTLGRNIRGHDPGLVARSKQGSMHMSFMYGTSGNISRRKAERLARVGRRRLAAGGVPAVALGYYATRPRKEKGSVGKRDDRFLRTYRRNISTGAERAYVDLGERKRKRYGDAATHGTVAGLAGLGALGAASPPRANGPSRLTRAKYGTAFAAITAASGKAAYNRWKEGRSLQERRNKIKAKAHERARAGELGRDRRKRDWANVPQPGVSKAIRRVPRTRINPLRPRPGGVMRTRSGRTVSYRGSIVGTGRYSRPWR